MGTSQHGQMPPDLVRGQRQFQTWREQREPGDSIPESLWAIAIRLAKAHGVSRTAAVLRIDYYRLKNRAAAAPASEPRPSGPAFIALTPPAIAAKQCQFEFDNGSGATMRVQLVGYDAADIEVLSRSFWSAL